MTSVNSDRRAFIKITACAIAVTPTGLFAQDVAEDQKEKVAIDSSTALALGYQEKSTDVDSAKYPTHSKDQVCTGCILYQGDDPEWGACNTFGGRLVAGQGWCQAYWAKTT